MNMWLQSCQKETDNQATTNQTSNVSDDPIQSFYDADQKHGFKDGVLSKYDASLFELPYEIVEP